MPMRSPAARSSSLQDVAHGFDEFAPQFADQYHVIGVTRRGYGASSQPATGYDVATRVADVIAVLDTLGLGQVALVGHSIAGDELTGIAAVHSERVSHLIYPDAVYDHSDIAALLAGGPAPPPMLAADSASPIVVQEYLKRSFGMPNVFPKWQEMSAEDRALATRSRPYRSGPQSAWHECSAISAGCGWSRCTEPITTCSIPTPPR